MGGRTCNTNVKKTIFANFEDKVGLTEDINRALRVMRFTIHTALEMRPFELHHGRKPKTELNNRVKENKICSSNWTTFNVSVSS